MIVSPAKPGLQADTSLTSLLLLQAGSFPSARSASRSSVRARRLPLKSSARLASSRAILLSKG